jgi:hypothetical protein
VHQEVGRDRGRVVLAAPGDVAEAVLDLDQAGRADRLDVGRRVEDLVAVEDRLEAGLVDALEHILVGQGEDAR